MRHPTTTPATRADLEVCARGGMPGLDTGGCGQQLGYATFTSLIELGQALRRSDTCASRNPRAPADPGPRIRPRGCAALVRVGGRGGSAAGHGIQADRQEAPGNLHDDQEMAANNPIVSRAARRVRLLPLVVTRAVPIGPQSPHHRQRQRAVRCAAGRDGRRWHIAVASAQGQPRRKMRMRKAEYAYAAGRSGVRCLIARETRWVQTRTPAARRPASARSRRRARRAHHVP